MNEFDYDVLDLVKQKGFYRYEQETFSNFQLPSIGKTYSSLKNKKTSDKDCEDVCQIWDRFEMKMMKDYHNFYLFYGQLMYLKNLETKA